MKRIARVVDYGGPMGPDDGTATEVRVRESIVLTPTLAYLLATWILWRSKEQP